MDRPGSSRHTTTWRHGAIEVAAEPFYLAEHSEPLEGQYVFGYRIEIANLGPSDSPVVQLLWRRWTITDGAGLVRAAHGSGVVGDQPELAPGERFSYQSFCPLPTPTGTMEGSFTFQAELADATSMFEVVIAPFELRATDPTLPNEPAR